MAIELSELQTQLADLSRRVERLEAEVAALRVNGSRIVARYEIEGEEYIVTQADIDRVKTETLEEGPVDRYSQEDWEIAVVSEKVAERRKNEPPEIGYDRFARNFEAARAKIIAEGKGIYDEREAVGDD